MEIFGNLFLATLLALLGNLCEPCLGTLLGNPLLGIFENFWEWNLCDPCLGTFLGTSSWESLGTSSWTLLTNLACEPLAENLSPGNFFLGTSSWEPLRSLLGNLPGNLFLGIFGNLFLNLAYKPCLRTSCWEPFSWKLLPGNLFLGTFAIPAWEPSWEPLLGNLWEPLPEPCLQTLPANLLLGTFLLETSSWEPLLGNLCDPCLGTLLGNPSWEPGNVSQWDFRCSDLDLYYGWRPQAYAVGEKWWWLGDGANDIVLICFNPINSNKLKCYPQQLEVSWIFSAAQPEVRMYLPGPQHLHRNLPEPHLGSAPEPSGTSPNLCTGTFRNLTWVCAPQPSGTWPNHCTGTFPNLTAASAPEPPEPHLGIYTGTLRNLT